MNNADKMLEELIVGLENSKGASAKQKEMYKTNLADDRKRIKLEMEEAQKRLEEEFMLAQERLKASYTQEMKDLEVQYETEQARIAANTEKLKTEVKYWKNVKIDNSYSNIVRRGTSKSSGAPRQQAPTPVPGKPPSPGEGPAIAELDSDEDE